MYDVQMAGDIEDCRSVMEFAWKIPDYMTRPHDTMAVFESPNFYYMNNVWCLWISSYCDDKCGCNSNSPSDDAITIYVTPVSRADTVSKKVNFTFEIMKENVSAEIKYKIKGSDDIESKGIEGFGQLRIELLKKSELRECESMLLSSGVLTIWCCIKTVDSDARPKSELAKIAELDTLSQDLGGLFDSGENSDVTLRVQKKKFRAHRSILSARSEVFASMFQHELTESKTGVVNIKDCDPDSFEIFLRYLYTGNTGDLTQQKALTLFKIADKYSDLKLRSFCVQFMKLHLSVDTVCSVAALADLHEEEGLFASSQAFFNKNFAEIFSADSWLELLGENYHLANRLLKGMASVRNYGMNSSRGGKRKRGFFLDID